jgi:hypothetical protein
MHGISGLKWFKKRELFFFFIDPFNNILILSINEAFMVGNQMPMRPPPALLKTPPYVTARPVITHRKMSLPPKGTQGFVGAKRFLVLGTDGLWDELR